MNQQEPGCPQPNQASLIADYRFCEYRLHVLERHPLENEASIAAIRARMSRLKAQCSVLQPAFAAAA
jgi:hypothetical protein